MPLSVKCRYRKEEALFGEIASIVYGFQKSFGVVSLLIQKYLW